MKKIISTLAVVAFLFAANVNAQEKQQEKKECNKKEMKSCDKDKKGGCCAGKKAEKKS